MKKLCPECKKKLKKTMLFNAGMPPVVSYWCMNQGCRLHNRPISLEELAALEKGEIFR